MQDILLAHILVRKTRKNSTYILKNSTYILKNSTYILKNSTYITRKSGIWKSNVFTEEELLGIFGCY